MAKLRVQSKRKRAPGGGRKPSADPSTVMYLRLSESLYEYLRGIAARRGQSLTGEIRDRLIASKSTYGIPEDHNRLALQIVRLAIEVVRLSGNPEFFHNPDILAGFQAGVVQLLGIAPPLTVPPGLPRIDVDAYRLPTTAERHALTLAKWEINGRALARGIAVSSYTLNRPQPSTSETEK